ncbi:hypothetical protein IAQ61_006351, partial [Plenodomus lingam]
MSQDSAMQNVGNRNDRGKAVAPSHRTSNNRLHATMPAKNWTIDDGESFCNASRHSWLTGDPTRTRCPRAGEGIISIRRKISVLREIELTEKYVAGGLISYGTSIPYMTVEENQ